MHFINNPLKIVINKPGSSVWLKSAILAGGRNKKAGRGGGISGETTRHTEEIKKAPNGRLVFQGVAGTVCAGPNTE